MLPTNEKRVSSGFSFPRPTERAYRWKSISCLKVALNSSWNIIANAATLGRYVALEGRVRQGVFRNWAGRYRYRPRAFVRPTTEAEIVDLIKTADRLRVFGSGHSFNSGVVTDGALVSLDEYRGLVGKDLSRNQICVRAGTRVRDVVELLYAEGLAFRALPSHDAQSIGGILSTDVHGTGTDWGFVSDSVVGLKIVDGRGEIYQCGPEDDLFKAAIGGIGAVGIILEVTVQGVPRFNVEQRVAFVDLAYVEENLDQILAENDHVSLYLFPFVDKCQINTWNRTTARRAFLGPTREFLAIAKDALLAAWFGNFAAYTGLLPRISPLVHAVRRGTDLVLESNRAFNRTIYHAHQELEIAVPFEETFDACRRFMGLYEKLYPSRLPYILFEVRFTPAGHNRTLIGPGREQRSTWIDLVCNDSDGYDEYYAAAEQLVREMGARPHLGKFCGVIEAQDLAKLHGEHFARFQQLVAHHDPQGKFANPFTRRLFAHPAT